MKQPCATVPSTTTTDLLNGFRGRCPCCGEGRLFGAFLKVTDSCAVCGEPFRHHRADDFPAYCVILLVGHLLVPLILALEARYHPAYWLLFAIFVPATLVMSIGLLQPIKGAIVAWQWRSGMHGFAQSRREREETA
jgi:uncharacterized protein (DUF983 family)